MQVYKTKTAMELAENGMHSLKTIKNLTNQPTKKANSIGTLQPCFSQMFQIKKTTFLLWTCTCHLVLHGEVFSARYLKTSRGITTTLWSHGQEPSLCQWGTTQEHPMLWRVRAARPIFTTGVTKLSLLYIVGYI